MYQVTLVNLSPDARQAGRELGASASRTCEQHEVRALLEAFRGIDPNHNVDPEPEIRIQYRDARGVVTVAHGRLLFSDARDRMRPTLALGVSEIMAELDGSAAASGTSASSSGSEQAGGAEPAISSVPVVPPARRHRVRVGVLSAAAVVLLAGVALFSFVFLPPDRDQAPPFVPLPAAELADTARQVAAVYVTGDAPGSRGIVVGGEGGIRIFELNAAGAPSFIHGTWQAGRIKGMLCLRIPELDTVVEIVDHETIAYCGQRYRRAASS